MHPDHTRILYCFIEGILRHQETVYLLFWGDLAQWLQFLEGRSQVLQGSETDAGHVKGPDWSLLPWARGRPCPQSQEMGEGRPRREGPELGTF